MTVITMDAMCCPAASIRRQSGHRRQTKLGLRNRDLRNRDLRNRDLRNRDLRNRDLRNRDLRNRDLPNRDLTTAPQLATERADITHGADVPQARR
jgi:uncharacterized protein YjbI with pentapeptide repeats